MTEVGGKRSKVRGQRLKEIGQKSEDSLAVHLRLEYACDGLVVLGGDGEAAHVGVDVDGLGGEDVSRHPLVGGGQTWIKGFTVSPLVHCFIKFKLL